MYGFKFGYGYGYGVVDSYNPLINYDWSTTTTSGLRYLKDVGSTPTYNASMYFGRGAYLNGVDQTISITPISLSGDFTIKIDLQNANAIINRTVVGSILNTDYIKFNGSDIITKIGGVYRSSPMLSVPIVGINYCFRVERLNGTVSMWLNDDKLITSFTENSNLILDSIGGSGGGAQFNGVFKDLFIFNRTLNQSEITQAYAQPEAFYAMAQADSTCVLNMPMCETDGYVRNMKRYSEGSELDTSFVANNYISSNSLRISQFNLGLVVEANKTYLVEIEYDDTANSILTGYNFYGSKGDGAYATFQTTLKNIVRGTKGTAFYLIQMPSTYLGLNPTTAYAWITTTAADKTAYISVRSLKEVTGVYPITNYTSSVRDNAKNLQYGLQTCKFVRDSLGVIQSASNYLECDGVGYGNTGWIPSVDEDWSIELITENKQIYKSSFFGTNYSGGLHFFKITNGLWYVLIGGVSTYIISSTNDYLIFTLVFKQTHYDLYVDGVLVINNKAVTFTTGSAFYLGKRGTDSFYSEFAQRLFKVHPKILTQAEITANYNSYVAKGLLV